jgi:hypothetical protein
MRYSIMEKVLVCSLFVVLGCNNTEETSINPDDSQAQNMSGNNQNSRRSIRGTHGHVKVELVDKTYEYDLEKARCKSLPEKDMYLFSGVRPEYDLSMVLNKPTLIFGLIVYDDKHNAFDNITINRTDYRDQELHQINGGQFRYSGDIRRGLEKKIEQATITLTCME